MRSQPPDSLRLFFALWPDEPTRTALAQLQGVLQGRRVPYDNLHLTLSFLGQQPAASVPDLRDILDHLAASPPALQIDRIGYFSRNRVAWAGMERIPDALLALHCELSEALRAGAVGFDDQRQFRPHVTLARDAEPPADALFTPLLWHARKVVLVGSSAQATGSTYQVIGSRDLDRPCRTPAESRPA